MSDDRPDSTRAFELGRRGFVLGGIAVAAAACTSRGGGAADSGTTAASASSLPPSPLSTASSGSAAGSPGTAAFVTNGSRDRSQVALTFHVSGERSLADHLLSVLADHRVPITAFIVGSWLDANPDFVPRFDDGGHELANHTYTHPTFASLGPDAMRSEVTRCRDSLVRLAQTPGDYFRTSGTANGIDPPPASALVAAADAGYSTVVGFDVDPSDYADPGAAAIVDRVTATVRPGSIASLHFGHQGTIDALPAVLSMLSNRGLQPVSLRTLLTA